MLSEVEGISDTFEGMLKYVQKLKKKKKKKKQTTNKDLRNPRIEKNMIKEKKNVIKCLMF